MKYSRILAWSLAGLVFGGSLAYGQTLADLARKEEERRKAVKAPSRVYTTQDVQRASGTDPTAPPPAVTPPATAPSASAGPATAAVKAPEQPPPDQQPKDEAYWRGVFTNARDRLERSSAYMSALKTQYDVLANRFVGLSDSADRGAVMVEMDKVQGEIDRLQQDVSQQTKELADLEVQARRAGVPAGWIRPPGH
jgi:hypothetical protein